MNKRLLLNVCFVTMLGLGLLLGGCATYYKVSDPSTGKEYYTAELDNEDEGPVMFKDARTKSTVRLQNSEVTEITLQQFEAALGITPKKPAASPAAVAPAPAQPATTKGATKGATK